MFKERKQIFRLFLILDINECDYGHTCPEHSVCKNTNWGFTCELHPEYEMTCDNVHLNITCPNGYHCDDKAYPEENKMGCSGMSEVIFKILYLKICSLGSSNFLWHRGAGVFAPRQSF